MDDDLNRNSLQKHAGPKESQERKLTATCLTIPHSGPSPFDLMNFARSLFRSLLICIFSRFSESPLHGLFSGSATQLSSRFWKARCEWTLYKSIGTQTEVSDEHVCRCRRAPQKLNVRFTGAHIKKVLACAYLSLIPTYYESFDWNFSIFGITAMLEFTIDMYTY